MHVFRLFFKECTILTLLCLLVSCQENFNGPVDNDISEKIIADYVRKVTNGNPYTLYIYTDQGNSHIRLTDSIHSVERICESGPAYVYFLDEEPDSAWPHACQSIWIDRTDGNMSVYRGENPLRGREKWLVINNLCDEQPRLGLSRPVVVNHPDGMLQPCLYYQFEEDLLRMEHQCLQISPASTQLMVTDSQSVGLLHIVAEDPDTTNTEPLLAKHYGFQIPLDSLYVPLDSLTTQRLESISVHYRLKRGHETIVSRDFGMPTSGSGKINL